MYKKSKKKKLSPFSFMLLLDPVSGMKEKQDLGLTSGIRNTAIKFMKFKLYRS